MIMTEFIQNSYNQPEVSPQSEVQNQQLETQNRPYTREDLSATIDFLTKANPESQPLAQFVFQGPFIELRAERVSYPAAAHFVEQFSGYNILPKIEDFKPNHRISYELDDTSSENVDTTLQKITELDPITAHNIAKPWRNPVLSIHGSLHNEILDIYTPGQKERMQRIGKELLENGGTSFTPSERDQSSYKKHPEKFYAHSVWNTMMESGGLDALDTDNTGIGPLDNDNIMHSPLNYIPELGGETRPTITREYANEFAAQKYADHAGKNGEGLVRGKTLSKLYKDLTGDELVDDRFTSALGTFVAAYFSGDPFNPSGNVYFDKLTDGFADHAGPQNTPVLKQLHEAFSLFSFSAGVNVKPDHVKEIQGKAAMDIIDQSLQDIGLGNASKETVEDFVMQSASEMKEWLGYMKNIDKRLATDHYNELLAIKIFTDVKLWQAGVTKKGFFEKNAGENPTGSLADVHEYFSNNPKEWFVRHYTTLYSEWSPRHIDLPKPNPLAPKNGEKLSQRNQDDLLFSETRRLIEEGVVTDGDQTLTSLMRKEMHTAHQAFMYLGLTPEQVATYYQEKMSQLPHDISDFDKVRTINNEIYDMLKLDQFTTRWRAQYAEDMRSRDTVVERLSYNLKENAEQDKLTTPILVVTCGDSRMEAVRVAMEEFSDNITTIGTAGNFNIPPALITEHFLSSQKDKDDLTFMKEILSNDHELANFLELNHLLQGDKMSVSEQLIEGFTLTKHIAKEALENPMILGMSSDAHPLLLGGTLAAEFARRTLAPVLSGKTIRKIEKRAKQRDYDIHSASFLDQDILEEVRAQTQEGGTITPEIASEFRALYESAKIEMKAALVKGFVEGIGLDTNTWLPGQEKVITILGHGAEMNTNNAYWKAYNCGACGGESGEPNAKLMAMWMNDPDVREKLKQNGIDLDGIKAIGGAYNTTLSQTQWAHETYAGDEDHPMLMELFEATHYGDDEAVKLNTSFLKEKDLENITVREARKDAERRSHSWAENMPEIGNSLAGALIVDFPTAGRAEEERTAFRINSANTVMLPEASTAAFLGVYAQIMEGYGWSFNSRDQHDGKAAMSYTLGTGLGIRSAGEFRPLQTLPWQMMAARKTPFVRPNIYLNTPVEIVDELIHNNETFNTILDQGYGMLTLRDGERNAWYTYVSKADKQMLGEKNATGGSWIEVPFRVPSQEEVYLSEDEMINLPVRRVQDQTREY